MSGAGNQAGDEGGAFALGRINAQVLNNIFVDNAAAIGAVGHLYSSDSALRMVNNTAVGNEALIGGNASLLNIGDCTSLIFANNIVAWQEAPLFVEARSEGYDCWMDFEYSALHEVGDPLYVGDLDIAIGDEGNIDGDPLFLTHDASIGPAADDDYHLQATSPCLDAGIPSYADPDGSPGDMGAFGGSGASSWDWDQDGWTAVEDCNDSDGGIHPEAAETANGLDDDCDGEIDEGLPADTGDTASPADSDEPPEDTGEAPCETGESRQLECPEGQRCGCTSRRGGAGSIAVLMGLLSLVAMTRRRCDP